MQQAEIAVILTSFAVLLIAAGLLQYRVGSAREERLHHFVGRFLGDGPVMDEQEPRVSRREEFTRRLNHFLATRSFVESTRIDLQRAGLQISPTRFFRFRVAMGLFGAAVLGLLLGGNGPMVQVVAALAGLFGGYMLARPFLSFKQEKRLDAFERHFADTLDVMVGGLEAGSSLSAAVELVSREMPPPISTEFARVLREASLGVSFDEAFKAAHDRLPSDDLGMFVSAISVQFRVGGNLATVLRTLGSTVRERLRIRGDVKTLTAQQRMSGWIVTAIPFGVVGMLLLTGPSYIAPDFRPGVARDLTIVAVLMIIAANIIIRRLLKIEV